MKYLDDLENDKKTAAEIGDKIYDGAVGRNLGKTNALKEKDLADFVELQKTKADSENSWTIVVTSLDRTDDLSTKNPNKKKEVALRKPQDILKEMRTLDADTNSILETLNELIDG